MARERTHQYRERVINPLQDGETLVVRNHNVIKNLSGRVIGDLFPDTSEGKVRFRAHAAQHPGRSLEFLGFGDEYVDKDGVLKRHGLEPDIQHTTTGGTTITKENAERYLLKGASRAN